MRNDMDIELKRSVREYIERAKAEIDSAERVMRGDLSHLTNHTRENTMPITLVRWAMEDASTHLKEAAEEIRNS